METTQIAPNFLNTNTKPCKFIRIRQPNQTTRNKGYEMTVYTYENDGDKFIAVELAPCDGKLIDYTDVASFSPETQHYVEYGPILNEKLNKQIDPDEATTDYPQAMNEIIKHIGK